MVWWWNGQRCDAIRCSAVRGGAFDFLSLGARGRYWMGRLLDANWGRVAEGRIGVELGLNWD